MAAKMITRCMACGGFSSEPAFQAVPEIPICKLCRSEGKKPRYVWVNVLSKPLLKFDYRNEIFLSTLRYGGRNG